MSTSLGQFQFASPLRVITDAWGKETADNYDTMASYIEKNAKVSGTLEHRHSYKPSLKRDIVTLRRNPNQNNLPEVTLERSLATDSTGPNWQDKVDLRIKNKTDENFTEAVQEAALALSHGEVPKIPEQFRPTPEPKKSPDNSFLMGDADAIGQFIVDSSLQAIQELWGDQGAQDLKDLAGYISQKKVSATYRQVPVSEGEPGQKKEEVILKRNPDTGLPPVILQRPVSQEPADQGIFGSLMSGVSFGLLSTEQGTEDFVEAVKEAADAVSHDIMPDIPEAFDSPKNHEKPAKADSPAKTKTEEKKEKEMKFNWLGLNFEEV